MQKQLRLRGLVEGEARGQLLVLDVPLSFYGDIDPETGRLYDGRNVAGKIIIAPSSRGSTVGPYVAYALSKRGLKPAGVIVETNPPDPILVASCVIADIPLATNLKREERKKLNDYCTAHLIVKPPDALLYIDCP